MYQQTRKKKKAIDIGLLLLLFFVFSLAMLFAYLQNIDIKIKNYYEYKKTVVKLHSYNQDLDNVLMRSYRYLDNDKVSKIEKSFDKEVLFLKRNPLTHEFGKKVEDKLKEIDAKYITKIDLVESFKTLNARIANSVYYLYELQKNVENGDCKNVRLEMLLREILFKVSQVFLGKKVDVVMLEKDLEALRPYTYSDELSQYFYMHTKELIHDIDLLHHILDENTVLNLDRTIDSMNAILDLEYNNNQKKEERLGLFFFAFAFIVLLVLIYTYLRMLKNRKEILHLAYHDSLTELPNRTAFEEKITACLNHKKHKESQFAVLFIDLDRFKVINDTLGHDVGDAMLVILASRIQRIVGKENFLARIGGDEFIVLVTFTDDRHSIDILISQIASTVRTKMHIEDYVLSTSASIGIAIYPKDGRDKHTLLKHADSAMYAAKEKGKDTYAYYTKQLSIDTQRRLDLEQALVFALKNKEFSLVYQPQYRLDTKKICGVEALVRWNNEQLGNISPEEFISVAEDTGLIVDLGYYIFKEACEQYVKWKSQGLEINLMAINISSVQLRHIDVFEQFKKIIEDTGIDAKHIEIELTERYIMEYSIENLTILDDLRALGCRISIDDFGTGYSSMSYLRTLSIDTIKIDKSFITNIVDNKHDAEVSKAIIALSHSLDYEVIAEGIETKEQENILKAYNCDMGQGYYFAKPMSGEDIISFCYQNKR